ncbi:MAG: hypothetical protein ACHRXM_39570 [Isosphaerales bacterium]
MGEFIVFERGASLIGDVVWQSTLFLLAGLAGGLILARRPARAHRLLLLAIVGALITPLCGQLVRRAGWGFWTAGLQDASPPVVSSTVSTASRAASPASGVQNRATDTSSHGMSSVEPPPAAIPTSTATVRGGASAMRGGKAWSGFLDRLSVRAIAPIRFPSALLILWCIVSGLSVVRLVVSLVRGHRLAGRARPIACESIEHAAGAACERLGLRLRPELRISSDVDCPAIWCWGRRPVILTADAVIGETSFAPREHVRACSIAFGHVRVRDDDRVLGIDVGALKDLNHAFDRRRLRSVVGAVHQHQLAAGQ